MGLLLGDSPIPMPVGSDAERRLIKRTRQARASRWNAKPLLKLSFAAILSLGLLTFDTNVLIL
jgi:hypothetical protein